MKTVVHRADERGRGEHGGWLSTRYSFSFADWFEPTRMGFGALRVINDDTIAPSAGFPMHGHRDMEIITFVTGGTLTHQDSLGNTGIVKQGEVQVMSAGTGVIHSEYNASPDTPLTLFQIWIVPNRMSVTPRYEQRTFEENRDGYSLLVGPDESEGGLTIHQDAYLGIATLAKSDSFTYPLRDARHGVYAFAIEGDVAIAGERLGRRDAIGISGAKEVTLEASSDARILLIEVPMH